MRKDAAAAQRKLLKFAALFDPARTARLQLAQTLRMLGWEFNANESVADGLTPDFCLREWYCALEVVDGKHYVLPGSPDASDDAGYGPGKAAPALAGGVTRDEKTDKVRVVPPNKTAFPSAPAPWLSPVRGLVLDKETAARHAAIRARGWGIIPVPQPLWEFAASKPHNAHYARRDLLMSLILPRLPFEARPVELQQQGSGAAAGGGKGASGGGRAGEAAAATRGQAAGSAARRERAVAAERAANLEASATGRNRKARREARVKVQAAVESDAAEAAASEERRMA